MMETIEIIEEDIFGIEIIEERSFNNWYETLLNILLQYSTKEYISYILEKLQSDLKSYTDEKTLNVSYNDIDNNFSETQTINGDLKVSGNIIQDGEKYEVHTEKLYTEKDEIITRDGAISGLFANQLSGIRANKYNGINDGQFGFDANGEARVGDVEDTQPLLTRDEISNLQAGQVLIWDGDKLKAVGSSDYVKNTDYATNNKAGLVKANVSYGLFIGTAGNLTIKNASNEDIDAKTQIYRPIVPTTLDYAVKSSITTNKIVLTDEEKTSAQSWLGVADLVGDINTILATVVNGVSE